MKRNTTKRSLLVSLLALIMCVTMLVGTTFAWFTDSASTSVNKIEAGKLQVDIVKAESTEESLKDQTFRWIVDGAVSESNVLWEPGATFRTEGFKIKSTGSLALKYKLVLNGVVGDTKLLEAIRFSVVNERGEAIDLASYEGHLTPAAPLGETLYIQGYMDKDAGNEYQGLILRGFGITVVAAQDTVESDSNNNMYDESAIYPAIATGATLDEVFAGLKDKDGNTIDFGMNAPAKDITLDGQGVANISGFADAWIAGDVTIKGVNFLNGACFTAKDNGLTGTVTFEDCTFYACDQSKIDLTPYMYNSLKNSGDGLCLDVETKNSPDLKIVIKNCRFVGEDDSTLNRDGWKSLGGPGWDPDTAKKDKSRGHAIMINGICGGGEDARSESVLIEGCTMSGIRGHAIQLYKLRMNVTVKDCKINNWGVNAQTAAGTTTDAAIRGTIESSTGSLTLSNNYFGLAESGSIMHVKVDGSGVNTDGSRPAGTH